MQVTPHGLVGWRQCCQSVLSHCLILSSAYPPDKTFHKIATYVWKHKWRLMYQCVKSMNYILPPLRGGLGRLFLHWSLREDYPERQCYYQSKASEDIPTGLPTLPDSHRTCGNHLLRIHEVVHNSLRCQSTNSRTKKRHIFFLFVVECQWTSLLKQKKAYPGD